MWLYYNSFIAETDTKEKKAEVLSKRKQTDKKWLARIWKTKDEMLKRSFFMVTNVLLIG